jgi:hypothetical protein
MPYTDDPRNVPADAVRFYVGDTAVARPLLTDNQVDLLLAEEDGNTLRAAARAAEVLAAKASAEADDKYVGTLRIRNLKSKQTRYLQLAKNLWAQALRGTIAPFAGGLSRVDKLIRATDGDRVRPFFARGMQRYPNGSTDESRSSDEELRP